MPSLQCSRDAILGGSGQGPQTRPTLIADDGGFAYTSVACGRDHCCGLRTDDRVVCFGANDFGQCGGGGTSETPILPTVTSEEHFYHHISAGYYHTCGLRANDSRAMCWG